MHEHLCDHIEEVLCILEFIFILILRVISVTLSVIPVSHSRGSHTRGATVTDAQPVALLGVADRVVCTTQLLELVRGLWIVRVLPIPQQRSERAGDTEALLLYIALHWKDGASPSDGTLKRSEAPRERSRCACRRFSVA